MAPKNNRGGAELSLRRRDGERKKINTKGQRDKGSKEKQGNSRPIPFSSFDSLYLCSFVLIHTLNCKPI